MCEVHEYQQIIDDLKGTCLGLEAHLESLGRVELMDTASFTAQLDDQIFECAECGWWCEQSEATAIETGEDLCLDCAPEDEG